jgi:hypothetical protein
MNKVILHLFFGFMPVCLMDWFYEGVADISKSGSRVAYGDILIAPPMVGA